LVVDVGEYNSCDIQKFVVFEKFYVFLEVDDTLHISSTTNDEQTHSM